MNNLQNDLKNRVNNFWNSLTTYFSFELPKQDFLKEEYVSYDQWNGGTYWNIIDYNYEFKLQYGLNYDDLDFEKMENISLFIELAYSRWITIEKRYDFTKQINDKINSFKLPYKLKNGKIVSCNYKTTYTSEKIINYNMLERKINFAETMILSNDILDKKAALDYIVDSLLYLVSIQPGEKNKEKISSAAYIISGEKNSKKYCVINNEIEEIIKISNEFFDIRHNEYLNKAKEIRESLTDPIFIEYLYNRVFCLLYPLKLKLT